MVRKPQIVYLHNKMDDYKKAENEAVEFATRAISFDQQNMYDAAIYYYRVSISFIKNHILKVDWVQEIYFELTLFLMSKSNFEVL